MPSVLRVLSPVEADEIASKGWVPADAVRTRPRTWLLPDRLCAEAVTIVEGDPQAGKSTWLSGLAAAVSSGAAYCGRPRQEPADVLWCAGEESYDVSVTPRLRAAGADMQRIHYPLDPMTDEPLPLSLPEHGRQIQAALQAYGATLLIIDPLICYASAECDLRTEAGARAVMDSLAHIARHCRATVTVSRHLKKSRIGPRVLWGFGSVAISGTARSILQIEQPDRLSDRRVMRTVRCEGGARVEAAEYKLDFSGPIPLVAGWRELSRAEDDGSAVDDSPAERDARSDAERLLRALLEQGPVRAIDVLAEARTIGVSERTLRDVKKAWRVTSRRDGDSMPVVWWWDAPAEGLPGGTRADVQPCSVAGSDKKKPGKPRKKKA